MNYARLSKYQKKDMNNAIPWLSNQRRFFLLLKGRRDTDTTNKTTKSHQGVTLLTDDELRVRKKVKCERDGGGRWQQRGICGWEAERDGGGGEVKVRKKVRREILERERVKIFGGNVF